MWKIDGMFWTLADFQGQWVTSTNIYWVSTYLLQWTLDETPSPPPLKPEWPKHRVFKYWSQPVWEQHWYIAFDFLLKSLKMLLHRSLQGTVPCKPHHLTKTWVAGQTPLLKSHSENTETRAVAWCSTKYCLDSTLGLCSSRKASSGLCASSAQEATATGCPAETAS